MAKDSLEVVFSHAVKAYFKNFKLIAWFTIPFLVALPLSMFLPNYVSLSGIFLRTGSIGVDAGPASLALIGLALIIALGLFSFALVGINMIIKSQRTLTKISFSDFQRYAESTKKLFSILLLAFLIVFSVNLLLYQYSGLSEQARILLAQIISFVVYLAVLFVPQAIVLDHRSLEQSIQMSVYTLARKPLLVLSLLVFGLIFLSIESVVFGFVLGGWEYAYALGLLVNALILTPFLEVLKTQIYLSKYSII